MHFERFILDLKGTLRPFIRSEGANLSKKVRKFFRDRVRGGFEYGKRSLFTDKAIFTEFETGVTRSPRTLTPAYCRTPLWG